MTKEYSVKGIQTILVCHKHNFRFHDHNSITIGQKGVLVYNY